MITKFSQMQYKRPELADMQSNIRMLLERFESATTAQEAAEAYVAYDDYMSEEVSQFTALAHIRNSMDTSDQFYSDEVDFWNEAMPELEEGLKGFTSALLSSPFRKELEIEWGSVMFANEELMLKTFAPEIIEDLQAEYGLSSQYHELRASAQIEFDGKTLSLAEFDSYFESPDPAIRRSARDAVAGWWAKNADAVDEIYNDMVATRTKMSKTLGYDNFIELGYCRQRRNCYDAKDVAKFRQGIAEHIVPLISRLKAKQAKRIGVDKISLYDNDFRHPDGNPMPKGTTDELLSLANKMYKEMSVDTAKFIDVMIENELFDIAARMNKQSGGYCTFIPINKLPFIFANLNGTAQDIETLTHEIGHALATYEARNIKPYGLVRASDDIGEIHANAMEFFAYPWMESFFGDQTEKYYESHLTTVLSLLPYSAMVDEFQHWVYENYTATPADRHAHWAKLEKKYRPYLDQSEVAFYQDGKWWQTQMHIFTDPFYYIEYALAYIIALNFWEENRKDPKVAWEKYMTLLRAAGTKTFLELIEEAGISTPLEPQNIKIVADSVTAWLDNRD